MFKKLKAKSDKAQMHALLRLLERKEQAARDSGFKERDWEKAILNSNRIIQMRLRKYFERLKDANRESKRTEMNKYFLTDKLSRMLANSSFGKKSLGLKMLRAWKNESIQREKAHLRMCLRMRLGQHNLMREVLGRLRENKQSEEDKEETEEKGRERQRELREGLKSKLARMLVSRSRHSLQRALEKLRSIQGHWRTGRLAGGQADPSHLVRILQRVSPLLKFMAYAKLKAHKDRARSGEAEDSKGRAKLAGNLTEEGQKKFNGFIQNLLNKPELGNATIDNLRRFLEKRNKDGKYDHILDELKHNDKDLGRLLAFLEEEARKGDKAAAEVKHMLDERSKFKVETLKRFMEDRNAKGKYRQLLEHMKQQPDFRLSDLSHIVRQNHRKSGKLGDLMDELDERKEVEKILQFMRDNDSNGRYSELIAHVEAEQPKLSDLLHKIAEENQAGKFDQLKAFVNDRNKRLREKVRDQMLLADPGLNGEFQNALDIWKKGKSAPFEKVCADVKINLEKRKWQRKRDKAEQLMTSRAIEKFDEFVNQSETREVDRMIDYLQHANAVLNGRLNPVVEHFNAKTGRGEDIRLSDLFDYLEEQHGITAGTVDRRESFPDELAERVHNDLRDLYRVFASGNKLGRCLKFIKDRNKDDSLSRVEETMSQLRPNRFSRFVRGLRRLKNEDSADLDNLQKLLNNENDLNELVNFICDSNYKNRNKQLLEFIAEEGDRLTYLGLVDKVLDLEKGGRAAHVLKFIDRDSAGEWMDQAVEAVRRFGDMKQADDALDDLRKLEKKGQVGRDEILKVIQKHNRDGQMERVLEVLDGKSQESPLMSHVMECLSKSKNPKAGEILDQVEKQARKRAGPSKEGKEEPTPQLADLVEVLNGEPKLIGEFPELKALMNEENKESRFEATLDFILKNNLNGKNSLLLAELDPLRVAKRVNRGRQPVAEADLPDTFKMADEVRKNHQSQPKRYQDTLDFFNQEDRPDTQKDVQAYLKWMNKNGEYDETLDKMAEKKGQGLSSALDVIREENEDPDAPEMTDVLERVDEEGLSPENMLALLRKYNSDGKLDDMIRFLEDQPNAGVLEILAQANKLNKEGDLDDFITFVKTGGVDPVRAGEFPEDPLFKILTKYRLLGEFPEVFEALARRPELCNPEALLEHLKAHNDDGRYDDLIDELERYVRANREFPDMGEFNKEHPLTKLIHRKLREALGNFRDFNRQRARAEKWVNLLAKKNLRFDALKTLNRFCKFSSEEQSAEAIRGIKIKAFCDRIKKGSFNKKMQIVGEMKLNRMNRRNAEQKILGKLGNWARDRKLWALMNLRANKTSGKYREMVLRGWKEKLWSLMIKTLNPGIFKALLELRKFRQESMVRENREGALRGWLTRMVVKSSQDRAKNALKLLEKHKHRDKGRQTAKRLLSKYFTNGTKELLRGPFARLRQQNVQRKHQEEHEEVQIISVLKRANMRAEEQQKLAIKNMQIGGLQLTLQQQKNKALLERVMGQGDLTAIEIKRRVLAQLREFCMDEREEEAKLMIWNKLGVGQGQRDMMRALSKLRHHNEMDNLKMSMNSLFKWKIANLNAKIETEREMDYLINLHRGRFLDQLSNTQDGLLRDALRKLRAFSSQSKSSVSRVLLKLINSTKMSKLQALRQLRTLNSDFNEEELSAQRLIGKLYNSLDSKMQSAFEKLAQYCQRDRLRRRMASRMLKEGLTRALERTLGSGVQTLRSSTGLAKRRAQAINRLLRRRREKEMRSGFEQWNYERKHAQICRFNSKITNLCSSLRKNHRHEMKSAFAKWSQKEMRRKYQLMANFFAAAKEEKKKETYIHMKILYMQKKFSRMCKVLGRFLEFVERRKKENKTYAFDALCLENPWADKVPKLLTCSRVMSAQMCFWKLRLTRQYFIKKRRQRGGGYKIDKLKLVLLEKIFTKKISQFFMQIQIGRPNKYL